jgi:DNA-binding XRE family transcriptional regulator
MFPNLEAEQARQRHSNDYVAQKLGISRQAYENKKKNGTFKLKEVFMLTAIYSAEFSYLFDNDASSAV